MTLWFVPNTLLEFERPAAPSAGPEKKVAAQQILRSSKRKPCFLVRRQPSSARVEFEMELFSYFVKLKRALRTFFRFDLAKYYFSIKKYRKVLSELPKSSESLSKLPPRAIRTPGAAQERPQSHISYYLVHFDHLQSALRGPVGLPSPTVPPRRYVPFI